MRPLWKWLVGLFLFLLISFGAVLWYYAAHWKIIVESKLKDVVYKHTDGLYTLRYEDLDLNIALGNATLHKAELIPDSAVYQKMIGTKDAPNNRYHLKIKDLKIRRFSLADVLAQRKLNIKTIILDEPEIHLMSESHPFNDTLSTKKPKTLYESTRDLFSSINVKDIRIDKVKFTYSKIEEGRNSDVELANVDIKVHDVLVDETSLADTTRLYYTKMVDIQIPAFEYDLSDGFYKAKFENLRINTRDQNVLLTKVSYAPKMSKAAFFKNKKQNVTMSALHFDTLRLEKLDFQQLIDNQRTIAKTVQIKNGSVDLSSDKRYPKYPVNKIGYSPHQQLMKAKSLLRIDTLLVDNIGITYHEFSAKYGQEGSISFEHAQGVLTNITNDTLALRRNRWMKADLSAKIMGSGNLSAQFSFDMLSKKGLHTYKGTLGKMKATAFNRILRPLLNVEIASGDIHKIAFNMQGTDYKNWGEFRFDYDDLKITLLNKPEKGEDKSAKKVVSFLINEIINNSNPDSKGKYTIGKVDYTRVKEHTFFKTMWQSLLDGIKQCAGISPEREEKWMGTADVAKDVVEGAKKTVKKTGNFFKNIFKKKEDEDSD